MGKKDNNDYDHDHENEVTLFGQTNFRNQRTKFGVKTDDRRRHMYVLGKTGMGKTTFLENMLFSDIMAGHGCCLIDPHGDSAEKVLDFIPSSRINDVVYFNPADVENPIGFNILEVVNPDHKHLVAAGLMGVFKKIWPDVWSARMEYILNNAILALLDYPGSTLMGINRLMTDKEYRKKVIAKIKDPVVKEYWAKEFAGYQERFRSEAISPIQNKVGQFLSASVIRNIVSQVKSAINIRDIMDNRKILIVNLSKGRIGEDNMRLLGGMIITQIQLAAMERIEIPEPDRQDFYLFVDEFQNFANESFASILSEARKYRLNLFVAHQYIEQLDETVRDAVFGNVGTIVCFRIGAQDAEFVEKEFAPTFEIEDFVNLTKFEIYLKLMIDGVASNPFSAGTLPPLHERQGHEEKVIKVSRERYSEKREVIEEKVLRWSGVDEKKEEKKSSFTPSSTTGIRRRTSAPESRSSYHKASDSRGGKSSTRSGSFSRSAPRQTSRSRIPSYDDRRDDRRRDDRYRDSQSSYKKPVRKHKPSRVKHSGIKSGELVTKVSEDTEEVSLDALKKG